MGPGGGDLATPHQPQQAFRSSVLLHFQFVDDERLESFGFGGCGELTVPDFLKLPSVAGAEVIQRG